MHQELADHSTQSMSINPLYPPPPTQCLELNSPFHALFDIFREQLYYVAIISAAIKYESALHDWCLVVWHMCFCISSLNMIHAGFTCCFSKNLSIAESNQGKERMSPQCNASFMQMRHSLPFLLEAPWCSSKASLAAMVKGIQTTDSDSFLNH